MDHLLSNTSHLINHVYWFQQDFGISPTKEHTGSSVNWTDLTDRTSDFLRELTATVTSWVYNKEKVRRIIEERLESTSGDYGNAAAFLTTQAFSKFRPGRPQGQFGELLLFNFIQHFFKAVPILRKQNISTSRGHERFGADAIHYRKIEDRNVIYIGESKCYKSNYQFNTAFETSLTSIIKSAQNINDEISWYVHDDFIEPELEEIVKKYKNGELENVHLELVCLIAYNENTINTGRDEAQIKDFIKSTIEQRCVGINRTKLATHPPQFLERVNYIVFPIWGLDNLLQNFSSSVGA